MKTLSAQSNDGSVKWVLDNGHLTWTGPKSALTASDTAILFGLLSAGAQDIVTVAQMELVGITTKTPPLFDDDDYATGVDGDDY